VGVGLAGPRGRQPRPPLPGHARRRLALPLSGHPRRPEDGHTHPALPDAGRRDGYTAADGQALARAAQASRLCDDRADRAVGGYPHPQVEAHRSGTEAIKKDHLTDHA